MAISHKKIFDIIKNTFSKPGANLDELIISALTFLGEPPSSQIEEAELIAQYKENVQKEIQKFIDDCKSRCIPPDYEFGVSRNFLINKKSSIQDASQDFAKWLSEINPIKFEFLCKKVLEFEGCENVRVTPPSADGGVDFWGTKSICVVDKYIPIIFQQIDLLVIGQAKRYSNPIGIVELRHFLGSFSFIKIEGLITAPECLPKVFQEGSYKPFSPILLIFITSAEFNENAKEIARWLGIRLLGIKELIYLFYENKFGFRFYENIVKFDPSDFDTL